MYDSKKNGGMGMRNLQVFNEALLAKQAWRILRYPNSLMAKTLKGKYFPNSSFLESKLSPMASFTWRSIWSARDLLQKGLKKVVGSGHSVDIWADPWVPSLKNFRPMLVTGTVPEEPRTVSDLICNGRWDNTKLHSLFQPWEIEAITRIPISQVVTEDKWEWHFTKHGEFTVRSAYFQALEAKKIATASSSKGNAGSIWSKLWKANLPTKIKNFGWRALHNGIAVKDNLVRRGLGDDKRCPLCGEGDETAMHTLVLCGEARMIWRLSPLRLDIPGAESRNFFQWCEHLVQLVREDSWWDLFWSLLWGIWLKRNAWIFDRKRVELREVSERALRCTLEFKEVNEGDSASEGEMTKGGKKWQRPREGSYKLNVDAAVFEKGRVGYGGVVRDCLGEVVLTCCGTLEGRFEADIAEALAARSTLELVWEAGIRVSIVESDCLKLVVHLQKQSVELSSFGNIVQDILVHNAVRPCLSFIHICRSGNKVAHSLVKLSRSFCSTRVWLADYPIELQPCISEDLLNDE